MSYKRNHGNNNVSIPITADPTPTSSHSLQNNNNNIINQSSFSFLSTLSGYTNSLRLYCTKHSIFTLPILLLIFIRSIIGLIRLDYSCWDASSPSCNWHCEYGSRNLEGTCMYCNEPPLFSIFPKYCLYYRYGLGRNDYTDCTLPSRQLSCSACMNDPTWPRFLPLKDSPCPSNDKFILNYTNPNDYNDIIMNNNIIITDFNSHWNIIPNVIFSLLLISLSISLLSIIGIVIGKLKQRNTSV